MLIYPAIDILGGRCVRLVQGDYSRETVFDADPVSVAKRWVEQGADRLHLVDLDGAKAGRPVNGHVVRRICESVSVPCQLGGGVRSDEHLAEVFAWGVRWAVLGTRAIQDPAWVRMAAGRFPGRIVLGLDARNGFVATDGWLNTSTVTATDLAKQVEDAPLAAVVYTDIAKDGMMSGPNYEALAEMRAATRLPVIASGGVSTVDQVRRLAEAGTFGCIIGRALYEGQVTLPEVLALVSGGTGSR
jgi:phosphoribosylformimino-5-aminoimidazole carboxamide ribotide isomerase